MIDLQIDLDHKDALLVVWGVAQATSPHSLVTFLETYMEQRIQTRAQERFDKESALDIGKGGSWEELKPSTVDYREAQGFPGQHPINRRTGELERYITQSDADTRMTATGATLRYPGSRATGELGKKVYVAQAGWRFPETPARPVLGWGASDLSFASWSLYRWILEQMRHPDMIGGTP